MNHYLYFRLRIKNYLIVAWWLVVMTYGKWLIFNIKASSLFNDKEDCSGLIMFNMSEVKNFEPSQ